MENEFNFKGEDEEVTVPNAKPTESLKFKTLNKTKKDSDQVYFSKISQSNLLLIGVFSCWIC